MKLVGYYNYTVIATYLAGAVSACGIFLAAGGNARGAIFCLLAAGALDMVDGRIASTMKRTQEERLFGIQIDSLCDLVSFGVLPAVIGWSVCGPGAAFYIGAVLYVLCAVIRLSYFNVDETLRQQNDPEGHRKYYYGCPVTVSALIFPLLYGLFPFLGDAYGTVYNVMLCVMAAAFILKVRLPKPGLPAIAAFALIGLAVLCLVFFV